MKNIFKKNQVIITALALMIAVAGYLNFTGDKVQQASEGVNDYIAADADVTRVDTNSLASSADIATGDESLAITDNDEYVESENEKDTDKDLKNDETKDTEEASLDISDEDLLTENDASIAVSDTGELAVEDTEDTTGEAILVNTTINNSFFSSSKLKREQTRAKNKELFMSLIDDENISKEQKQEAVNGVLDMTAIAEKENVTETLLEAKGFSSVVTILDGTVEVVVNAATLSDQDVAVIEDTVKRKTGIKVEHITITPVEAK